MASGRRWSASMPKENQSQDEQNGQYDGTATDSAARRTGVAQSAAGNADSRANVAAAEIDRCSRLSDGRTDAALADVEPDPWKQLDASSKTETHPPSYVGFDAIALATAPLTAPVCQCAPTCSPAHQW